MCPLRPESPSRGADALASGAGDRRAGAGERGTGAAMSSWLHDTGYGPALDHEGGVTPVVQAGTDPDIPPDQVGPRVIGWRAGCQCGWRGTRLFLRAEWRTTDCAIAPEQVAERCRADWERHLRVALPVLGIHDFTRRVEDARENLVEAVRAARPAGVGWTLIGEAAGISGAGAKARWSDATRPGAPPNRVPTPNPGRDGLPSTRPGNRLVRSQAA